MRRRDNVALSFALLLDFQRVDHFAMEGAAKPFRGRNPIIACGLLKCLKRIDAEAIFKSDGVPDAETRKT